MRISDFIQFRGPTKTTVRHGDRYYSTIRVGIITHRRTRVYTLYRYTIPHVNQSELEGAQLDE